TAETNSDFIVASIAAERAARAVRSKAIIAAAAANEISRKARRAPLVAAIMVSSGTAWARTVQDRIGRVLPGAAACSTGSKNNTGNFRSRTGASRSTGSLDDVRLELIRVPLSSKISTAIRRLSIMR